MTIEIRALQESDDRSAFRSGDADLDRFFARFAAQNQFRHHIGMTFVAVEDTQILGYVTIAAAHVESEALGPQRGKLPRYPLPVLRLARLAVDRGAQSRGLGAALLRYTFTLALRMSKELGCIGVLVDAKPAAVAFYARFGFVPLAIDQGGIESRPRPQPMFLLLDTVRAAQK